MKLRVYFIRHRLKHSRYENIREHFDFPSDITPEAAYAELLTKYGSVMDGRKEVECEAFVGQRIKVAPDQYITINSHALVDEKRESVVLPSDRFIDQALFGPMELRACLQDSPDLKARTFARKRRQNRE